MQPTQAAIDLVKASEGLRLSSYQDDAGIWTIGWGHTADVIEGMAITEQQALDFLAADLSVAGNAVSALVKVSLTQSQFDALADFVFNEGEGHLRSSTLLRLLNAGQYQAAAAQFKFWNLAAGQVEPGLVTRRAKEAALFLSTPANVSGGVA
ncbi:lysozyme [Dyella caseinilytica]|uniref:Lysozyme n=1 Tax=Dyella caseinilytica TaxID=1849581 RepID=A0ABX7GZJ1_9GAMM|nr:lysozyme [Dyella caseinilytica]QRN55239.1 lysozyme [Dyella caseinilytica]GGA00341.1 lysozyme [Dyella caseinilytica]